MATITALHPHPTTATIQTEIDTFLADLHHRRGVSENTVVAYRYDLTTAAQSLTGPLDAITTAQIETFLASRDEKTSTNNRRIASLRRFFTWAVRQGLCANNPVADVEAKRDETTVAPTISPSIERPCPSRLNSAQPCWSAVAALHLSFVGMGRPLARTPRSIVAEESAVR